MKAKQKIREIKEIIGNPNMYLEETTVFAVRGSTITDKYNALLRLCEMNRKMFLSIIAVIESGNK